MKFRGPGFNCYWGSHFATELSLVSRDSVEFYRMDLHLGKTRLCMFPHVDILNPVNFFLSLNRIGNSNKLLALISTSIAHFNCFQLASKNTLIQKHWLWLKQFTVYCSFFTENRFSLFITFSLCLGHPVPAQLAWRRITYGRTDSHRNTPNSSVANKPISVGGYCAGYCAEVITDRN